MKRLRIGVAGLRRGAGLAQVFKHHPKCELAAVCDVEREAADRFAQQHRVETVAYDYESLIERDLDVVVVATPLPLHAAQSVAAMEAGKHVFSEVPAAATLAECERIVRAVEKTGKTYMMGENVNYFPRTLAWKREVDRGRLGEIFYGEAEYVHDCGSLMLDAHGQPTWRAKLPPIHYCTHSLGPLLYIARDRCLRVSGMHTGCHVRPHLGTIDMEVGIMQTAGGRVLKILCGFSVVREPAFHYYCLYGTRGMLESQRCDWDADKGHFPAEMPGMQRDPVDLTPPPAPPEASLGGHGTSEYFMVDDFVACLLNGSPAPIDVYAAMDYTVPGICAHLSAERGGELIEVPDFRPGKR
jgi:predicted dehydrogenase